MASGFFLSHVTKFNMKRVYTSMLGNCEEVLQHPYLSPPLSRGWCVGLKMVGGSNHYKTEVTLLASCVTMQKEGCWVLRGYKKTIVPLIKMQVQNSRSNNVMAIILYKDQQRGRHHPPWTLFQRLHHPVHRLCPIFPLDFHLCGRAHTVSSSSQLPI